MSEPRRSPSDSSAAISPLLRHRMQPVSAAAERTFPVTDALAALLPSGLPRGTTSTIGGDAPRSLTFALVAAASRHGSWLAVLGLGDPGWRAVAELGVAVDRVVVVDAQHTGERTADCVAAALDGFELVLVGSRIRLKGTIERRLAARARERGAVLVGLHDDRSGTHHAAPTGPGPFDTVADLRMTTRSDWSGLAAGTGRLTGRLADVTVEGRRLPGRRRRARLWLPGPDGTVTAAMAATGPASPASIGPGGDGSGLPEHRIGRPA